MINVILVDDHRIVRDGIKSLITSDPEISVVGEANNFSELTNILTLTKPDIIILDISLPDISGIEIAKILALKHSDIKIIMLTMFTDEEFIFNSIKYGVKGYLPKNTTKRELIEAIKTIFSGEEYFSETITNIILKSYIKKATINDKQEFDIRSLTKREEEILKLCAEGSTNKEIADKLNISTRTVESHKNHLMNKLELKSNIDLVKFALKQRIIEI